MDFRVLDTTGGSAAAATAHSDPRNQTFYIAGPDGVHDITIYMATIEAQRTRLAAVCINYGCQLGLSLAALIVVLMLVPSAKLRRAIHAVQVCAIVASVIRLALLVLYFTGPLSSYYVAWTQDASILNPSDYYALVASNAIGVLQFALIETALTLQSWAMVRTWPDAVAHRPATGICATAAASWVCQVARPAFVLLSVALALATVVVKAVWVAHYTIAVKGHTLPVPLDDMGQAAVALGAASIFFFCGVFFAHLSLHISVTRGILSRPDKGLTSLEILAIGNGVLMLLPSLFAGLDIAAGMADTKVLPFDAGSWVQTITVIGIPLIGMVAFYRGANSRGPASMFAAGHGSSSGPSSGPIDHSTLGELHPPPSPLPGTGAPRHWRHSGLVLGGSGASSGRTERGGEKDSETATSPSTWSARSLKKSLATNTIRTQSAGYGARAWKKRARRWLTR